MPCFLAAATIFRRARSLAVVLSYSVWFQRAIALRTPTERAAALDGQPGTDEGTAADWLPGIRDEHEGDDAGWMARWLDRPTWDWRVTPNVIKRTGERPSRRGGRGFR